MNNSLRALGFIGLVCGLLLASWAYFGPGVQQQIFISQYVTSRDKNAFYSSHPHWPGALSDRDEAERLASEVYGFGIVLVGVGLILVSRQPEAAAT